MRGILYLHRILHSLETLFLQILINGLSQLLSNLFQRFALDLLTL